MSSVEGESAAGPLVLILDDEAVLRRILRMLLTREGFAVALAADPADAIAQLAAGLRPAVALVDMLMPGMTGEGFVTRARELGHTFPAILVSATPQARDSWQQAGFVAHVSKPYEMATLLTTIRAVSTNGSPPLGPATA